MKLTGDLRKKVEATENRDEAKRAIADAGMELNDDELDAVAGGNCGGFIGRNGGNGISGYNANATFSAGQTVQIVEGSYKGCTGVVTGTVRNYYEVNYSVRLPDGKVIPFTANKLKAL